jgi:hypothetical protein
MMPLTVIITEPMICKSRGNTPGREGGVIEKLTSMISQRWLASISTIMKQPSRDHHGFPDFALPILGIGRKGAGKHFFVD